MGRGGVRVVLEDRIENGREYELFMGDDSSGRRVQVAWSQDAADGQIAGLKYLDAVTTPDDDGGGSTMPPPTGDE